MSFKNYYSPSNCFDGVESRHIGFIYYMKGRDCLDSVAVDGCIHCEIYISGVKEILSKLFQQMFTSSYCTAFSVELVLLLVILILFIAVLNWTNPLSFCETISFQKFHKVCPKLRSKLNRFEKLSDDLSLVWARW